MNHTVIDSRKLAKLKEFEIDLMISACGDNTFLKNKQSVNVFNDDDNIIWWSVPRLQSYKYTLPQYVWLFINQNKVTNLELRNYIFNKINSENPWTTYLFKIKNENKIDSVYFPQNKNFIKVLNKNEVEKLKVYRTIWRKRYILKENQSWK